MRQPGASFGPSWVFLGRFWGVHDRAFSKLWSKMGFKRPFGWILAGFWVGLGRILGGFGEDLGAILLHFWKSFGKTWGRISRRFWTAFGTFCKYFLHWDPCAASLRPGRGFNGLSVWFVGLDVGSVGLICWFAWCGLLVCWFGWLVGWLVVVIFVVAD